MNFSDPFGRLASRERAEYEALQRHLREAGVDSREQALAMLAQSRQRMMQFAGLLAMVCLAVVLLQPQWLGMVLLLGTLLEFWLLATTIRGQRLFKRYIAEQFDRADAS